jgi:hypothetical protein
MVGVSSSACWSDSSSLEYKLTWRMGNRALVSGLGGEEISCSLSLLLSCSLSLSFSLSLSSCLASFGISWAVVFDVIGMPAAGTSRTLSGSLSVSVPLSVASLSDVLSSLS